MGRRKVSPVLSIKCCQVLSSVLASLVSLLVPASPNAVLYISTWHGRYARGVEKARFPSELHDAMACLDVAKCHLEAQQLLHLDSMF